MPTGVQPSILWREGMFLCPHHLQALSREFAARLSQGESLGLPGAHGLIRLKVDDEALARDVFSVLEASVLFRDGALAEFPITAQVEPREFGAFFTAPELDVFLGVPAVTPNVPQIDEKAEGRARYDVRSQAVFDENLRDASKDLEFRHLRARLFFGEEDRSGHECLPIARLVRRGKPVARSVLSATYVPTVLAIGASVVLMRQLREVADLARAQARDLVAKIPSMSKIGSVEKGTDVAALLKLLAGNMKLQAVNQCVTALDQLAGLPDLHPFDAYRWLAQSVGNLAIFGESRLVPELPLWDHAQQDACFQAVMGSLRALLPAEVTPPYDTVAFKKDPVRQGFHLVELPPEWLERQPLMYLAIEVGKPAEAVVEAVGKGLKLLAPADVERVLSGVIPGIGLAYDRIPPLAFPKRADLHYFRIQTEGPSRDSWLRVLKARSAVLLTGLAALSEAKFHFYVELRS